MQTVVFIMHRKPIAQGVMQMLKEKSGFNMYYEPDYEHADTAIRERNAKTVLLEVAENGEYDISYCLSLSARLKKENPLCKLILMCPEQNQACVNEAVVAKKSGRIDEFVFYDTSVEYLATKIISM